MRLLSSFGLPFRVLSAVTALTAAPSLAWAEQPPTPTQCTEAFEESQRLSNKGKLQSAMEHLIICAQPTCPQFLAKECSSDYESVSVRVPTIIVRVHDHTQRPVTDALISMDGEKLRGSVEGVAIPVDPGLHEFTFERPGSQSAKVRVVVAEGQKNQPVVATLEPLPPAVSPSPVKAPPSKLPPSQSSTSSGIPTASYVLGAIGIAGLATGTAFRLVGAASYRDLESRCGRTCPPDDVTPVKTKFTISSIGFGVGAAALLAAGVVLVAGGGKESKTDSAIAASTASTRWSLRALYTDGGGVAVLEGDFND
jgi:hypothetical protein